MKKVLFIAGLWLTCFYVGTGASKPESFEALSQRYEKRLEEALEALSRQRMASKDQFIQRSQELRRLKEEEILWREKYEKQQRIEDSKGILLSDLQQQVEAQSQNLDRLSEVLLREFISARRAHLPAHHPLGEELRQLDLSIESKSLQDAQALQAQLHVAENLIRALPSLWQPQTSPVRTIDSQGLWIEGQSIDIGPEAFFYDASSQRAGHLGENELGQSILLEKDLPPIKNYFEAKRQTLPLDVTGRAHALQQGETSIVDHLQKGGLWIIPILIFALLSAICAMIKLISLYSIRVSSPMVGHELAMLMRQDQHEDALRMAQAQPPTSRTIWLAAIERGEGRAELTEEVIAEELLGLQPILERFLSFIAVTSAIAPLLGLLGTVTGIIKTFQMMEVFGTDQPQYLIGGISEALITTEVGLILAIPALLLHALLSRRAQSILAKLELSATAFVNGLTQQASPPDGKSHRSS